MVFGEREQLWLADVILMKAVFTSVQQDQAELKLLRASNAVNVGHSSQTGLKAWMK